MPSDSLETWNTTRLTTLNEIENAHHSVGGVGPGRRTGTEQLNRAYAVLLASEFQGFCRDLHNEATEFVASQISPTSASVLVRDLLLEGRKLDRGNASSATIGPDFGRFGLIFWQEIKGLDKRNQRRMLRLDRLNEWRNAIVHNDYSKLGPNLTLALEQVRRWKDACCQLATAFDKIVRAHLESQYGKSLW